jgi:hypothetical protein
MRYGLFFFGVVFLGIGFEFAQLYDERWGRIDLFLNSDRSIYPSSYVYYSVGHLTDILLASLVMYLMTKIPSIAQFKHYALLFVVLEAVDLLDFWLTNNDLWFEFTGYPVTFNVLKVLVFILVIIYDYALDYLTSPPTGDVP